MYVGRQQRESEREKKRTRHTKSWRKKITTFMREFFVSTCGGKALTQIRITIFTATNQLRSLNGQDMHNLFETEEGIIEIRQTTIVAEVWDPLLQQPSRRGDWYIIYCNVSCTVMYHTLYISADEGRRGGKDTAGWECPGTWRTRFNPFYSYVYLYRDQ